METEAGDTIMEERELVPVRVKPYEREMEMEEPKPIEELPDNWRELIIQHRWRVKK